ncbi:ATP-dependent helicase, partial [Microbacterium sp. RD11]|nr:ATP-dependent helicase [Microbacterium sp. RD11]
MPKNKKPRGGRAAANFEPRYGAKKTSFHDRHRPTGGRDTARDERPAREDRDSRVTGGYDRRPGSRSPGHRGYRPEETESGAPKRRWSSQERAGRDEARGIRNRAESGRREAPHRRDDRAGAGRFDDRSERPRYNDRAGAG